MESKTKIKGSKGLLRSWFCKYNLISVTLIAFGISSLLFLPDYMEKKIFRNLEIRPDSRSYEGWKKPTIPLYLDIYLFNWTNPEDIKNSSTKPVLKQIGPYRFRDYPDKHNITFHDNNSTVSYKKSSTYFFEPEMSNGTLDDIISAVNLLALGAASKAKYWNGFKKFGVSASLGTFGQKINVVKTVREMLFEGYEDSMLALGSIFGSESDHFNSIGFMVNKNASDFYSGKYTVHTGVENMNELGKILKYNDLTYFPHATGECKKLQGSPGEFYPPKRNKKDILHLFTPEMCRSLPHEYQEDRLIHGLKANRYVLGERAIDNGTSFSDNKCHFKVDMPSGVWNQTDCAFDQPFYVSYPHFYLADKSYLDALDGLSPQKDLHESYITLDEKLSVTLEAVGRYQMNVLFDDLGSISLYSKVPKIMMPLFYVEQKFIMNEEDASKLYYGILILSLSNYAGFVLIFLGLLIFVYKKFRWNCHEEPQIDKCQMEEVGLVIKSSTN